MSAKRIHPKVTGAALGAAVSGLISDELTLRLHVHLLPSEYVAIGLVGLFVGGWLKRGFY